MSLIKAIILLLLCENFFCADVMLIKHIRRFNSCESKNHVISVKTARTVAKTYITVCRPTNHYEVTNTITAKNYAKYPNPPLHADKLEIPLKSSYDVNLYHGDITTENNLTVKQSITNLTLSPLVKIKTTPIMTMNSTNILTISPFTIVKIEATPIMTINKIELTILPNSSQTEAVQINDTREETTIISPPLTYFDTSISTTNRPNVQALMLSIPTLLNNNNGQSTTTTNPSSSKKNDIPVSTYATTTPPNRNIVEHLLSSYITTPQPHLQKKSSTSSPYEKLYNDNVKIILNARKEIQLQSTLLEETFDKMSQTALWELLNDLEDK